MSGCNGLWSVLLSSQLVAAVQSGFYDSWKPHAYCNDVQHIHNTRIEPLSAQQQSRVVGLIQVQVRWLQNAMTEPWLIRIRRYLRVMEEGLHTIASSAGMIKNLIRWMRNGIARPLPFRYNSEKGLYAVRDIYLHVYQSQDIESDRNGAEYGRLYRKQYMAAHNVLKGDCVVGGLLPEGRQQHLKNGE